MPEPSTTEGRQVRGELRDLLETAAVQQAESSASRRRGVPRNYPRHRLGRIERPQFIPSLLGHQQPTRPPRCTTASATDARRKATTMWSAGDGATTTMGPPEATTRTEVVATTVGMARVLLLGHLALESLARPSAAPTSLPGFGNRPTSQSTAVRPTSSCGWPITTWLVS